MLTHTYKYILLIFAALASVMASGCRTKQAVQQSATPLPAAYTGVQDSLNSADIQWQQYFTDPGLLALIEEGLKNNPDRLSALQKTEAARSYVKGTKGALFPALSANAAYAHRKFGLYTMDGAGNISTTITPGQIVPIHLPDYYLGLQTSWEADVWGKLRSRRRAALSRYLATVEGSNLVVTNLVAAIAAGYYELLQLDNELDLLRETIRLQENALTLVDLQKQAGMANELAVKQFRAQVLNSRALEYETLQQIIERENAINFLLGRYPQPVARSKESFNGPFAFQPKTGIPSQLLRNRPDIRQAEFEVQAAKADVKAARAAFYPSLVITGSLGFQAFNTRFLFQSPESIAYSLLGNLVAPLVNRAAIKAEFGRATAVQQDALFNYQKSILNGYVEVYNEMAKISNLDSIAAFKSQEAEVLAQSVETSGELFKTGRANYIEVLMAQKNSLASRLELLEVRKRQYHAFINVYKALGGGWK